MTFFEWLFLVAITTYGYKAYQKQEYWLDRQIAKLVRIIKSQIFK